MKKIIAVTVVALMMFAFAASAFALLPASTPGYKNPPVFIDGLVVSDAWMSGLTMQNWKASLTNQAYAEGSYIWFIAKLGVSSNGDTDAPYLWDGRDNNSQTAELTMTGKDNCLNFSSANMATLARISGMSIDARAINNNNLGIVEATDKSVKYTFTNVEASRATIDSNRVLWFDARLEALQLDPVVGADVFTSAGSVGFPKGTAVPQGFFAAVDTRGGAPEIGNRATIQKDFYLHFMAITKAATEGVCVGTMKVNGTDTFDRFGNGVATASSYQTYNWYNAATLTNSSTHLEVGDQSQIHMLYNSANRKTYAVMKIKNGNGGTDSQFSTNVSDRGPWGGVGEIYVVMNDKADSVVCAFVVDGSRFVGLAKWNYNDWRGKFSASSATVNSVQGPAATVPTGALPWYYESVASNDYSGSAVEVAYTASDRTAVTKGELQDIFDFFGFAYANPRAPGDADILERSKLVTVAEAKYNVANAVIATPDQNIVVPKTGDAATSTGLILVASAILAAAAVGFVLSKRAHN